MAGSSSFTQAQIDALTAAIASGATEVRHGDKLVKYASIADMLRLRDRMCRDLEGTARPVARFARHNRGDRPPRDG